MPVAKILPGRTPDVARATDRELVAKIAAADADAFEELYRRHSDHAFMLARKLCASRELAEEVTQESFIALWRSAHRYRPALGSVSVWLSSIIRNRAIDAWRRASVRPVETPVIEDGPGQLHTAIGADTPPPERAVVLSLIGELPAPQKEAVFLAYFGGMTHDEIAAWSHTPLGTVKGRIRMGLQKIRERLEADERAPACEPLRTRGAAPASQLDGARRRREARPRSRRTAAPAA
jgi:RNA polymerase sigma-70 factor (ECF subfamily)